MVAHKKRLESFTALTAAALGLALGFSACAFKKDTEKPADPRMTALQQELDASKPITASDLKVTFEPGDSLNHYSAIISWPAARPLLVTVEYPNNKKDSFDGRTQNQLKTPCLPNGQIQLRIRSTSAHMIVLSDFSFEVVCPRDLRIDGEFDAVDELQGITGTLQIGNRTRIRLSRKALALDLENIEIQGGAIIETFDSSRATTWYQGNSTMPPEIRIKSKTAKGLLTFNLNGIDGAPLPKTRDIEDSTLNGAAGSEGEVETLIPLTGPKGQDGATAKFRCAKQPGRGQDGNKPPKTKGEPGARGNDGLGLPKVTLNIMDSTDFVAEFYLNPGLGSGGAAGSIYIGGSAGAAGSAPPPCRAPPTAAPGANSLPGDPGDNGASGGCGQIFASRSLSGKIRLSDVEGSKCSKTPHMLRPI